MELIDSKTFNTNTAKVSFPLPIGSYYRLAMNFSSTLATGEGANLVGSDFGNFSIRETLPSSRVRGDVLDFYSRFKNRNTIQMKDIDTDTLVAWFFNWPIQLPFDNETVLIVEQENTVFFEFEQASTMSTRLGANTATVELWAEYRDGISPYRLLINSQDFAVVNGTKTHPLGYENVNSLLVEYNTTLTNLKWRSDGKTKFDATNVAMIQHTLQNNPVEDFDSDAIATTLPFLELAPNHSESLLGLLNENNSVILDASGSTDITITSISIDFNTPSKLRQSVNAFAANNQAILDRKRNASPPKTRALEIIDILSGR